MGCGDSLGVRRVSSSLPGSCPFCCHLLAPPPPLPPPASQMPSPGPASALSSTHCSSPSCALQSQHFQLPGTQGSSTGPCQPFLHPSCTIHITSAKSTLHMSLESSSAAPALPSPQSSALPGPGQTPPLCSPGSCSYPHPQFLAWQP